MLKKVLSVALDAAKLCKTICSLHDSPSIVMILILLYSQSLLLLLAMSLREVSGLFAPEGLAFDLFLSQLRQDPAWLRLQVSI